MCAQVVLEKGRFPCCPAANFVDRCIRCRQWSFLSLLSLHLIAEQLLLKHIGTAHGAPATGYAPPIISRFQAQLIVRDSTRALNGP
jgi:hypothetical protein